MKLAENRPFYISLIGNHHYVQLLAGLKLWLLGPGHSKEILGRGPLRLVEIRNTFTIQGW